LKVGEARASALAAHAAARSVDDPPGRAAARAAGHAAATAHVAEHARAAGTYAVAAAAKGAGAVDSGAVADEERAWQRMHLPEHLHAVAFPVHEM